MAKIRTEKQQYRDMQMSYQYHESRMLRRGETPRISFEEALRQSKALAKETGMSVKEAFKRKMNSVTFTPYEERVHKNVTNTLKKEGMMTRLYRMGGKSSFEKTSFVSVKDLTTTINNEVYRANGYYLMGDVQVTFWTAKDSSNEQYIQYKNHKTGAVHMQRRMGDEEED